ncbi:hypothetical protein Pan97_11390 [Bremerella volcania]|uniref:Uncharacterized protein n=1 Tax=Bremerella volcania TaxID=2527984 RepID=A0A518C4M1_9BACT|nr:hypothetical protein [Bremerella volcania]QDU74134.1 hypothetical protein Pan97_11390 [Bremerella volcania]
MNETHEEGMSADASAVKPYESPTFDSEDTPTSQESEKIWPSAKMFAFGMAIGFLLQLSIASHQVFFGQNRLLRPIPWGASKILFAIVSGLGITLLAHALWHRKFFALMPGHWLFIWRATDFSRDTVVTIYALLAYFVSSRYGGPGANTLLQGSFWAMLASNFVLITLFTAILVFSRESRPWKFFIWACLFLQIFIVIQLLGAVFVKQRHEDFFDVFNEVTQTLILVSKMTLTLAGITAIVVDLFRRRRRDMYHYLGLAQVLAVPLIAHSFRFLPSRF